MKATYITNESYDAVLLPNGTFIEVNGQILDDFMKARKNRGEEFRSWHGTRSWREYGYYIWDAAEELGDTLAYYDDDGQFRVLDEKLWENRIKYYLTRETREKVMDDSSHEIFIKEKSAVKPPIALTGKARSGKDTVAKYLDEKYGYVPFAFSDDIKRIAKDIFPWRFGKGKDREILQQVGEKMREIDPDVWVKKTLNRIDHFKDDLNIVITDLRMPNEYAACRERGFVIIRIEVDDDIRRKRMIECGDMFQEEDLNHETEKHIDGFDVDYVIQNNGDIESLYEQVDEIMKKIIKG